MITEEIMYCIYLSLSISFSSHLSQNLSILYNYVRYALGNLLSASGLCCCSQGALLMVMFATPVGLSSADDDVSL